MVSIIHDGGSVMVDGRTITRVEDLPGPEALASSTGERDAVRIELERQRADLDARIATLGGPAPVVADATGTPVAGALGTGAPPVTEPVKALSQMNREELVAEATKRGITVQDGDTKEVLLTAIKAHDSGGNADKFDTMTVKELTSEAATLGITIASGTSKEDIIAQIKAKKEEGGG